MSKRLLFALAALLFAGSVSRAQSAGPDLRSFVPSGWKLLARVPGSNERRFVSPSGDAWLSLYTEPAHGGPVRAAADGGERVTYARQGSDWAVVSGYKGERIFYRRVALACSNRQWHHLAFEYPAAEKRAFDAFVTRASFALQRYQHVGCH